MRVTIADINNPATSAVRARVQRAPRRAGSPNYPGAAWKTIAGMTGLMPDRAGELAEKLRQEDPARLYKVVTYNVR